MPNLIITPYLEKALVQLQGVVTIERDMTGGLPFGIRTIEEIPWQIPGLQEKLRVVGQMFIDKQRGRGYEYVDAHNIHYYGPYQSRFYRDLLDLSARKLAPRQIVQHVRDRSDDAAAGYLVDFLLVADFIATPKTVEYVQRDEEH